jgi:hypothetical protein
MAAFTIIIVIVIIILVASDKKKMATTFNATGINHTSDRKPSPTALEIAYKYFGIEWQNFVTQKTMSFNQPKNFHETIAFSLEKLSTSEHKALVLTFLGVSSNSRNRDGRHTVSLSAGLSNYENLHSATFNLVQAGKFSELGMLNLFRQQISLKQQQREAKKEQDNSIIDVTGKSQQLNTSQYSNINNQSNYQQTQYSYNSFDSNEYRLGKQYKDKLKLSTQEISWLNKFWNPTNVFIGIEGCCVETIKLYLAILKGLNKQLKKKETSIAKEVEFFQTEIMKLYQTNNQSSYWGGYDNSYLKERAESEIFLTIFKRAENTVREAFGHKRKISGDFPYSNQPIVQEFENRIGLTVNQIILSLTQSITPPDEKTEVELNFQNINRWKFRFEQLEKSFSEINKQEFINGIYAMEKSNQKNPSIENIFLEASKFIAKVDKTESLKFYIYYLYYDLKSDRIDNKQLTKTIQKNLFKTNEQLNDFGKVVAELVKTKDLKVALEEVVKIYQPKRKKIQLDATAIKEVQQQDKWTVEKLNEYLQDEFTDETTTVKTEEINSEEIKLEIEKKYEEKKVGAFTEGISLSEIQASAIALFAEKSFNIPFSEIDIYCKSKGVFKNQLINSINESCYEVLDDVLIEEDGDNYILNENYYKKISLQ